MKKLTFIISLLLFAAPVWAAAPEKMEVTGTKVRKVDQNVEVSFDLNIEKFSSNYTVTYSPVLYNGDNRQNLESITITGARRQLYNLRNKVPAQPNENKVKGKSPKIIRYKTSVPYQDWMNKVSLSAEKTKAGCCSEENLPGETLAKDKLLYFDITPYFDKKHLEYELTELEKYSLENPFLHPIEDYDKRHDILLNEREKGTAVVNFTVGSARIDTRIEGNKELLVAVGRALRLILDDPNASLKRIVIAGYASPEGTLKYNTNLAQQRADAVKAYLLQNLDIPNNRELFELFNGREDWDGLRSRVDASDMEYRAEVLEIIDAYTMEQEERKVKLRQLAGGKPYAYMLENFYPPLRNAGYLQVYYDIDRTATYATAVVDENGRMTWIDPDSPANIGITRINRAKDLMIEGSYESALRELLPEKENPLAFNLIGVCYMMLDDFDQAEGYLGKAVAKKDEHAPLNIEQIETAKLVE